MRRCLQGMKAPVGLSSRRPVCAANAVRSAQQGHSDFDALEAAGCGSLRLLRALDGTRILQAAAPTAPPCFGRWPRSSPLQTRGCSPLVTPKLLGSIQKIQAAALEDFLCSADLKSLARRNVRATACFYADVNAPAGSQHQQMPFAVTTLPVKKQLRNGRSRFGVANKNTISAIYAQSEAESIPNRLSRFNAPSQNPPARLRRSGGAPVSAPASRRIPGGTVPGTTPAPAAVRCRSPSKSRTSRW